MFEKIKPLHDRVLVERVEVEGTTPAGLIIPDAAKEKAQTGRVVAVGQGRTLPDGRILPVVVAKDDIIFFGKYAGTEAGDKYLIVREEEILGVLENK
ncbi:MAG: co-chaperone GroES [Candidatus Babeliales bacterium]